ncbi:transmembrane protein, putative [Bodo saltans]|uniref:Transmembrane protein, putative n=1 Tax=Bodo saltans TaxID=75058 RepID=A0A0S4IW41_BODSA|nr:transmembrane protein, putative [Bodo saltans]|eukprot:CUG03735.1 transmembrane protein, putative [Bodo saltans]
MSPSLDASSSASPISCSRLDKVSLVYDPTMMVAPADGNISTTATISDHNTFEFIAASVDRRIILTASVISASFDFGDHTRWTIVQANVVSDETLVNALSLFVTSHAVVSNGVVISLSSSNVTGSSDSIPWIPHGLSIYGSTTVELQLQLQCTVIDAVRNETFRNASTLALRLPSPGISLPLSPQLVSVVVARSQLIGSVAGVGAASGSARLASITVAQCGADNNGVSGLLPISVAVPSNCNFTSPYLDDINAIAGNWVVVLVGTAAAVIACAVLCLAGSSSFVDAMRLLTFPLCVLPLWVAAAPSSGAAAIHLAAALLVSGDEECTSVFVVVIGAALLLVITVISGVLVAVWIAHKHFTRIDVRIAAPNRATSLQMCSNLARWSLANSCEWKMLDKSDAATRSIDRKLRPTRHIDALLSEFRVVGYSALDLVNTVIVSLIAGAALGAGTFSWCIGSLAFSLALFCVQLCICIALRPHITWFYFMHSVVAQVLAILSVGLALGAAVANSQPRQDVDLIVEISTGSAVVNLLSVGMVSVRTLLDLRSFAVALHRILQLVCRRKVMASSPPEVALTMPESEVDNLQLFDKVSEPDPFRGVVDCDNILGAELDNVDLMMLIESGILDSSRAMECCDPYHNELDDIFTDYGNGYDDHSMLEDDSGFWDADGKYRERSDELRGNADSSMILEVKTDRI